MGKKQCIKCGQMNSADSMFCENCGEKLVTSTEGSSVAKSYGSSTTVESSVSSERVASSEQPMSIGGGNSAVSAEDIVSGGKNNTTHNTSTIEDNSVSTIDDHSTVTNNTNNVSNVSNVNNGVTAADMQSILSVVMDANQNTIKQLLEAQQASQADITVQTAVVVQDQSQAGNGGRSGANRVNKGNGGSARGDVGKSDDEYNEYQLVAHNLQASIIGINERLTNIKSPDKSYYMRDYHFILWIAASIFIFFLVAATAINILWFALLGALGMVVFSLIKRFKGKEAEPRRVKFDEALEKYKSIRSTVVLAFGENNEIVTIGDNLIDDATEKFEAAERKAIKSAKVTTAIICGVLFAVGYLVVSIVVG